MNHAHLATSPFLDPIAKRAILKLVVRDDLSSTEVSQLAFEGVKVLSASCLATMTPGY